MMIGRAMTSLSLGVLAGFSIEKYLQVSLKDSCIKFCDSFRVNHDPEFQMKVQNNLMFTENDNELNDRMIYLYKDNNSTSNRDSPLYN